MIRHTHACLVVATHVYREKLDGIWSNQPFKIEADFRGPPEPYKPESTPMFLFKAPV